MPAYIARYELDEPNDDLREIVLMRDDYWSPSLSAEFDRLAGLRHESDPMLKGWYYDEYQTSLVAWTIGSKIVTARFLAK